MLAAEFVRLSIVDGVTHNRMTNEVEMNPNLMRPPSFELKFKK